MSVLPIGNRTVEIFPPAKAGPVTFEAMTGSESLGRPFEIDVDVLSPTGEIPVSEVLGESFSIELSRDLAPPRWWNGIVTRFAQVAWTGAAFRFRAKLRPTMWLMTRRSNCRVYQHTTVPDLILKLFAAHGVVVKRHLGRETYPSWEYLVQYNETDFQFVSRLMELEGIFYYFVHEKGKHTLWLVDALTIPDKIPGLGGGVPFATTGDRAADAALQHEMIDSWSAAMQVEPGALVAMEYDFEDARNELKSTLAAPKAAATADHELFEYPGHYLVSGDRDDYVQRRLESQQLDHQQVQGTGNARALAAGFLFSLEDHPSPSQNQEYLLTSVSYQLTATQHTSGGADAGPDYRASFTAIEGKRRYYPPMVTPRPFVQGPQTALVVGPKGEEIWADDFGRVKVQFHWDRFGKRDEESSLFVRVSQAWAGSGWGAVVVPRIGQEVIVDFLEGNPDRPIITGRVYNNVNMPPFNKTQSGIRSHSTPGGGPSNFNEVRFEDSKGKEELNIQAEKDQSTLVKNNQTINVNADRSVTVGGNETINVTGNETVTVSGTRSTTITGKETQTFSNAREMTVAQTNSDTITGKHTGTYNGGREETVLSGDTLTVNGSDKTTTVHGKYDVTADSEFKVTQGANTMLIKDAVDVNSIGEIHLHNSGSSLDLKDGVLTIWSANEIKLECGPSSISIKSDGTIALNGPQKVTATGGGSGVELHQPGATMSGAKATVSGSTMTEITGGVVKIN
ncbi:MAG TPA: type VI secretion system tip protein TssI/VgrG [Polyangia bacterium]|jgi:type VI secretion system secreted protein VgrG|nr:type VI secretion system tip protein TssI/VgrG [Polyangia bacterium]